MKATDESHGYPWPSVASVGLHIRSFENVAAVQLGDDVHAAEHVAENRVLAVELGGGPAQDEELAVGRRGIRPGMGHRHRAGDVLPRLGELRDADRRAGALPAPPRLAGE